MNPFPLTRALPTTPSAVCTSSLHVAPLTFDGLRLHISLLLALHRRVSIKLASEFPYDRVIKCHFCHYHTIFTWEVQRQTRKLTESIPDSHISKWNWKCIGGNSIPTSALKLALKSLVPILLLNGNQFRQVSYSKMDLGAKKKH